MPVNRQNRDSQNCWSCGKMIGTSDDSPDYSLDGGERPHVCETCWEKMPVGERIKLQLLARTQFDDGLGIPEALTAFRELCEAVKDGQRKANDEESDEPDP